MWKREETLLYRETSFPYIDSNKVAAFDMDYTLIKTKSGKRFPIVSDDWMWWSRIIPPRLKQLNSEGYNIVIFTNQAGISKGKVAESDIINKINNIITELNIPISVYISTANDWYRKPCTTMWEMFLNHMNISNVDFMSFYCGDAAGRVTPKDFSVSDRKFAHNCRLTFFTPEEFFLSEMINDNYSWRSTDPRELYDGYSDKDGSDSMRFSLNQELVLLVGAPASGKTTLSSVFSEKGYIIVNQDRLKTKIKCLTECRRLIEEGDSVVIDRTNPKITDREEFIRIAIESNVPVRCVYFTMDKILSMHMNLYREKKDRVKRVSDVAIHTFYKRLENPTIEEGFSSIMLYTPMLRFTDVERRLFLQWT